MILSTVPGRMTLGCSRILAVSRFSSAIFADLAMRGFAISFVTLARIALLDSCFDLLLVITHDDIRREAIQSGLEHDPFASVRGHLRLVIGTGRLAGVLYGAALK